ncbi:signal peptide peptidase SppA, partial [Glaciecola sp. HTCC2999]|uniref:signal peptide peptidase SppA n=1 Tax=Glaciecola sp. HTCC2999 TaxID=455436 RepID=UPI0000E0F585
FDEFVSEPFGGESAPSEILDRNVVKALDNAKQDKRIAALVLDLSYFGGGGLHKLRTVAATIDDFKTSEKPVIAMGDYFSQSQYYLAAHADKIYLNPEGGMLFEGYSRNRMYYKEAIEKLKVKTHVFKVGTFKSAIEPYIRNDMSDAAREANEAWLSVYWDQYKHDVAAARNIDVDNFDDTVANFMPKFEAANGDLAQYALQNGWVDELKTREQMRQDMIDLVGESDSGNGYKGVTYSEYLQKINLPFPKTVKGDAIAVVVAKGTILDGTQSPGTIGGDSTARLLRKARLDDNVKAVVMHVDSPGGSAFASEIIRQEVEELRHAGKPVVALMGTYAASGGYWISASADKIIASPSTITGSIGIFGMLMTYEESLAYLGVYSDGVQTTEFGFNSLAKTLPDSLGNLIQRNIERGYEKFITLVAENRNMTLEQVDSIAQGRVWIGTTALELGLVDELGTLNEALSSAAELAELTDYEVTYIERTLSPKEQFIQELLRNASVWLVNTQVDQSNSPLVGLIRSVVKDINGITRLNDPKATYALCLECQL